METAALTVMKSKMHSWESFGYKLDSNHWQVGVSSDINIIFYSPDNGYIRVFVF